MPRLLGKPQKTSLYLGITVLAAVSVATVLEYVGVIDIIPSFGQSRQVLKDSEVPAVKIPNNR
jgi:hypothetical protein